MTTGIKTITYLEYPGTIYSKKNSKKIITNARTGKPQIVSNGHAKNQELNMLWEFSAQLKEQGREIFDKPTKEYEGRAFEVEVTIYQPDRKRRDLDNQLTAILDGLVGAMALPDDSNKFIKSLSVKQGGVDKENPRAEITIRELENVF